MTSRYIPDMTSREVREVLGRGVNTAIIPLGATEQHGPHAPFGTDSIIAEELALRIAERIDALVAPTLSIGFSPQHMDWPGSITLQLDTFKQVIIEVAESLHHHGFTRQILLNAHGGNRTPMDAAARDLKVKHGAALQVMVVNLIGIQTSAEFQRKVEEALGRKFGSIWGAHGGEQETSAVMARNPKLVHLEHAPQEVNVEGYLSRSRDPVAWTVVFDLKKYTPVGSWGDPRGATAEQGEAIYRILTDELVKRIPGQWE